MSDISKPPHYNQGKIQPIEVIEDWDLSPHLANVVKYINRCEHKGTKLKDLNKAMWYLDRYINNETTKLNIEDMAPNKYHYTYCDTNFGKEGCTCREEDDTAR